MSVTAALLARAIVEQGPVRYDEATHLITMSRQAGADGDLSAQIIGQGLAARVAADRGHHAEAQELANRAVQLAAQTDLLSQHADVLLDLAHVLAAAGHTTEAHAAATQALDLHQRKGNLPGVRDSLRYAAQQAPV